MQVSLLLLLVVVVADTCVRAMPFFQYYFPESSQVSIVPSIQTHEEHSAQYFPFGEVNHLNPFIFVGQSKFFGDIIGNNRRQPQAHEVYFTSTHSPRTPIHNNFHDGNNIHNINNLVQPISYSSMSITHGPSSFRTGLTAFAAGGPDRLPYSNQPLFVQDFTEALFRPTLVPYNSTLTTTTQKSLKAAATTSPQASTPAASTVLAPPPPIRNITDRTAPTTAPFYAARIGPNDSFNGTEIPPGTGSDSVRTQKNSEGFTPPPTGVFYDKVKLESKKRNA